MYHLSPLESLPTEILTQVLSFVTALEDLHHSIFASVRLYEVFKSAKRTILASILIRELGPALRDVVAAVLLEPVRPFVDKDRYSLIEKYRQILTWDIAQIVRGLSPSAMRRILPFCRDIQCYTAEYASSRAVSGPMSISERHHLAQAIARSEILSQLIFEYDYYANRATLFWTFEFGYTRRVDPRERQSCVIVEEFLYLFEPEEQARLRDVCKFRREMSDEALRRCDRYRETWRKQAYAQYRECPQFYAEMEDAREWVVRRNPMGGRRPGWVERSLRRLVLDQANMVLIDSSSPTIAIETSFEGFWRDHDTSFPGSWRLGGRLYYL